MRESVFFELRLRRFGVWRFAVWLVAAAAIAAMAAWGAAMRVAQPEAGGALVLAVAAGLSLATIGAAIPLARLGAGRLTCAAGLWTFLPDAGVPRTGTLEVAMDLGTFLLLRLVEHGRTSAWLPVQRRGLEAEWHGLRCAAYAPPPVVAGTPTAAALPAE
jgi:4-amino-4-deoxy-L-arabinose transferase-like glycosyltransferase